MSAVQVACTKMLHLCLESHKQPGRLNLPRLPGGSVIFWFAIPFSDVAGKDGRSGDDDESNVDELNWRHGGFGCFGRVGVVIACGEDVHDLFGVVVGCTLQGGWRRSETVLWATWIQILEVMVPLVPISPRGSRLK